MKECKCCNKELNESEFPYQRRKLKSGSWSVKIRSTCKQCWNQYNKEYRHTHLERSKEIVKNGKIKLREFIKLDKTSKGCSVCGYNKTSRALHYHHLKPEDKNFEISWAAREKIALAKVKNEIDKCVVVCANCHAEIEDGILIL